MFKIDIWELCFKKKKVIEFFINLHQFFLKMSNYLKTISDPVHGFIKIPHEILFKVIEHPYFQRLRRISQTGLLSLIFPGATHTRFHHA